MSCKNLYSGYNNAHPYAAPHQFSGGYSSPSQPGVQPFMPPTPSPYTPMTQPAPAMAYPTPPVAQPAMPMVQPTPPMAQPAMPMARPTPPVTQPTTPTARPMPTPVAATYPPFGGAYNAEPFTATLSANPTTVSFDAALPAAKVTFAPGQLTVREAGTYEISYELLLCPSVSAYVKANIMAGGVKLPTAKETMYAAIGRTVAFNHSTFATLPAGAAVTMQLSADVECEAEILLAQLTLYRVG